MVSEFTTIDNSSDIKSISAYGESVGALLKSKKLKVCVVEATSGGLISASLLAQPGASRFFVSSCVMYSLEGIKQFLPEDIISRSSVMDIKSNYKNHTNYVNSKKVFVKEVSEYIREKNNCDYCLCESGTSGPEFYIPGVTSGFSAISIASRNDTHINVIETNLVDRELNMYNYMKYSLDFLSKIIIEEIDND